MLIFGTVAFVCIYRGQTFPVVFQQVCTHGRMDFGPLLLSTQIFWSQISQVSRVSLRNTEF